MARDEDADREAGPGWAAWLAGGFAGALGYATVRYHVFAAVPWERLPLFTVNKAVSVTALGAIAGAYLAGRAPVRVRLGLAGFALTVLHLVLSLWLLTPDGLPKLYQAGRLSPGSVLALVAGGLGTLALCGPAVSSVSGVREALGPARWRGVQKLGLLALALTAVHVAPIGFAGWLTPGEWPGHLPPITLVSFAMALVPLGARLLRRPQP